MRKCEPVFQDESKFPGSGVVTCYCKTHSYKMCIMLVTEKINQSTFECPFGEINRKLDEVMACRS